MIDKPDYELYSGPVDSPLRYVNYCIHQGRATGKTHKLLMSIPDKPIVLVVHSERYADDLKEKLKKLRPEYNIKNITFVSYGVGETYIEFIRGLRLPIYYDNAVLDVIQLDYVRRMNSLYGESK